MYIDACVRNLRPYVRMHIHAYVYACHTKTGPVVVMCLEAQGRQAKALRIALCWCGWRPPTPASGQGTFLLPIPRAQSGLVLPWGTGGEEPTRRRLVFPLWVAGDSAGELSSRVKPGG